MFFKGRDLISAGDLTVQELETILSLAKTVKSTSREVLNACLRGYVMANLFFEASTRSRMSFASAFMRLGGQVNNTTGMTFSSMAKGETLWDTIRVLEGYCDIIVIRHQDVGSAKLAATAASIPVINAGDGPGEHPTQALLDLYTIFEEKGAISDLHIAVVGDLKYGRTVHSLIRLLALYPRVTVTCVAPTEVQLPRDLVDLSRSQGLNLFQVEDLQSGIASADVVYATRIQQERFANPLEFEKVNNLYILTRRKIEQLCSQNVTIMHPLPRTNEVAMDVDDLAGAAYFRQAHNGIPIRMALFLLLLGQERKVL